jgi:hypothetical protein
MLWEKKVLTLFFCSLLITPSCDGNPTLFSSSFFLTLSFLTLTKEDESSQWSTATEKVSASFFSVSCLAKSTPERLFLKKIEQKLYEDARHLAKQYKLSLDPLYQNQWLLADITQDSISVRTPSSCFLSVCISRYLPTKQQELLNKVQDKHWALRECVSRIPSTHSQLLLLLEYGKRNTEAEVNSVLDSGSFSSPDFLRSVLYHLLFIRFEARLCSYLAIRSFSSNIHFHPSEFFLYRSLDLVELARRLAYREDVRALEILFRHHLSALKPYRLQILSSFPESTKPSLYESLLSVQEEEGEENSSLFEVSFLSVLEKDKTKLIPLLKSLQLPENLFELQNDVNLLLERLRRLSLESQDDFSLDDLFPASSSSREIFPDNEDSCTWFIKRAKEIDNRSGFLNNSVELLRLAAKPKGKCHQNEGSTLLTLLFHIPFSLISIYLT